MAFLYCVKHFKHRIVTRTEQEFEQEIKICRDIFEKKTRDYGTSWRILRLPSLTDQIFIKANRIRSIEETGVNKIGDDVRGEYVAMVNYAVMALIQQELENGERRESERDRQGANGLSTENGELKHSSIQTFKHSSITLCCLPKAPRRA